MSALRLSAFLPRFLSTPLTIANGLFGKTALILGLSMGLSMALPLVAAAQTSAVVADEGHHLTRAQHIQLAHAQMQTLPGNTPVEQPRAMVNGGQALSFGSVSAEKSGMEKQVTFTFTRMATVGKVNVLTLGARNADYTEAGGGTCEAGHTYATGASCTVNVKFTPKHAGARRGAVELLDESDGPIVTEFLEGTGNRSQVIFPPGTQIELPNTYNGTSADDFGLVVDGSGNVFTTNGNPLTLYEYVLQGDGTYSPKVIYSFGIPDVNFGGIAIDGSGNVYVPDSNDNAGGGIYKFTASSNYAESYILSDFFSVNAVAFDPAGNMYIADFGDAVPGDGTGGLYKSTFSNNSFGSPSKILAGECVAVATDANGNIYASFALAGRSDDEAGVVYKWSSSLSGPSTVDSSYTNAQGIAVDPAGNVYVADDNEEGQGPGTAGIYEDAYNGGSYSKSALSVASQLTLPEALTIDGNGNLYVGSRDTTVDNKEEVYEFDFADGPSLTFASTEEGNLSASQSVTLQNIGNQTLDISTPGSGTNPSPSAGYQITGGTCPLVTSSDSPGTLLSNATCTYKISFDPTISTGTEAGTVVIDDSEDGGASQTINITGTATSTTFALSGYSTTQVPGTSFSITVTAQNSSNATDTGFADEVRFTSSDGSAVLPANTTLTNGTGTFSFTLNSTGNQTITVTDTSASSLTATTSSINDQAPGATHFSVSAPGSATAGTSFNFTVTAETAQNNTATGYTGTVHFTSTDSQAVLPANVTLSNGVGTFSATLKSAGSQNVTATDTVTASIAGTSPGITVIPGPASSMTLVTGITPSWYQAFSFTVTAYDAYGNTATGDNDTVAISYNVPSTCSVAPFALVNGTANSGGACFKTSGPNDTIYATDTSNPSLVGSATFNIAPGPASTFGVSTPNSTYAGAPFNFTVTAYDISANIASGYTGTATFTSTDPAAVLPAPSTLTNGVGTFSATLVTAGTQSITATDSVNGIAGTSSGTLVTIPNFVVNVNANGDTNGDDAGSAKNCTIQTTPGTNTTDSACSLRDALLQAGVTGSGSITFDGTAFASTNPASTNTIFVNYNNGTLPIPAYTSIIGPTTGSGYTLANLVTVDGGGTANPISVFTVASGATASISGLTIANGGASSSNGDYGGGIYNGGNLTVSNSTFINNTAPQRGGAIYNATGTLAVQNCTFITNSSSTAGGGAIFNVGAQMTVTGSTFSGNTAAINAGAIGLSSPTTVSDSTFVNNAAGTSSSSGAGGAIGNLGGTLTVNNSIFSGNSSPSEGAGIYGVNETNASYNLFYNNLDAGSTEDDCNKCTTNANEVTTNPNLAPLSNYGGPTQTLLPLPGSGAICAASSSLIPAGTTTDQRGLPDSTTYGATTCYDLGAVQTNYALAFGAAIPSGIVAGQPISPAPTVGLTESGAPATAATGTISITDTDAPAALSPSPATASLASGVATFSNLVFNTVESSDTLTATLPITSSINITAPSSTFSVGAPSPAVLVSPVPGTTLTGATATFTWTPGAATDAYYLLLGTKGVGSYDLDIAPASFKTSATFTNIPTTGGTLYARLFWRVDGTYYHTDYTYTEYIYPIPPVLTSPAPGLSTVLSGSTQTFTWSPGQDVSGYYLILGTNGVGSFDLGASNASLKTSATFTNIPTNGTTLFVRLAWRPVTTGVYQYIDYQMTESGTSQAPSLTSPLPGSTLPASNASFIWNPGVGSEGFEVWVGTKGAGSSDAYNSGVLPASATSTTAPTLPAYGGTLYIRFSWHISGVWQHADSTCVESGTPVAPTFTSPTAGSTLGGSTQTFTWSAGMGPDTYYMVLGSKEGGVNLGISQASPSTSATFTNIPTTGATVNARLFYRTAGVWQHADYTFVEASGAPSAVRSADKQ
jgi:predicted outer membrane repeat protein